MTFLYWIRAPHHTDIHTEGYVGITDNPQLRLRNHSKRPSNPHLANALKKYDVVSELVLEGPREYIALCEFDLRPSAGIGWNVAVGGDEPPSQSGKLRSEETKCKMRKPKPEGFGEGERNSMYGKVGCSKGTKWYYDPVTKYSKFYMPGSQPEGWLPGRYSRKRIDAP